MIWDENSAALLKENLLRINENIAEAALRSGRKREDILLCAATKTQPPEVIREALATGLIDLCGENRVQEFTANREAGAYGDTPVDFIGHLQKNKIKYLLGNVRCIQSVDSVELAQAISDMAQRKGIVQDIMLEINPAQEDSKFGFTLADTAGKAEEIAGLPGVRITGIMSIPPIQLEEGQNRPYFERLHQLLIDIKAKKLDNISMDFLSMGMTNDYLDAILCGSNLVRIGTAIFGKRS